MSERLRTPLLFALMATLFVVVGELQSWSLSLAILNLCLISAIMSLGVNIQWGYGGLLNVGIMGFAALGGLAAVLAGGRVRGAVRARDRRPHRWRDPLVPASALGTAAHARRARPRRRGLLRRASGLRRES